MTTYRARMLPLTLALALAVPFVPAASARGKFGRRVLFASRPVVVAVTAWSSRTFGLPAPAADDDGLAFEDAPGTAASTSEAEDATVQTDLPYPTLEGETGHPKHVLDVYRPEGPGPHPVIVFVHGGGWRKGDKGPHSTKGEFFAAQGYLFVSVNYRLTPEVQHPAHVQDVAAAVAYVRAQAHRFGGDASRVFLMGHSAGAHLAALVATRPEYLGAHGVSTTELAGVVLLDGAGYDIPKLREWNENQFQRTYAEVFGTDDATLTEASPRWAVEEVGAAPPHLVTFVDRPMGRAQSQAYAETLRAAGVDAAEWEAVGETHESINKDLGTEGSATTDVVVKFLEHYR